MMRNESEFRSELQTLINKYSAENGSNTPDFLLAEYLVSQLNTWDQYVTRREQWWRSIRRPYLCSMEPEDAMAARPAS